MRGVSFKPQDAEDFSTGEIKSYGGIYAATAEDFALAEAIEEGQQTEKVSRKRILNTLEGGRT